MKNVYNFVLWMLISVILLLIIVVFKALTIHKTPRGLFTSSINSESFKSQYPTGTLLITRYDSYSANIISSFTSNEWNHVSVVVDEVVYEICGGLKSRELNNWITHWEGKRGLILKPKQLPPTEIKDRIQDLQNQQITTNIDLFKMMGLLVGKDYMGESLFCTKFIQFVLDEEGLPFLPGEYECYENKRLVEIYHPPDYVVWS